MLALLEKRVVFETLLRLEYLQFFSIARIDSSQLIELHPSITTEFGDGVVSWLLARAASYAC